MSAVAHMFQLIFYTYWLNVFGGHFLNVWINGCWYNATCKCLWTGFNPYIRDLTKDLILKKNFWKLARLSLMKICLVHYYYLENVLVIIFSEC